jgi:hypothetical protein
MPIADSPDSPLTYLRRLREFLRGNLAEHSRHRPDLKLRQLPRRSYRSNRLKKTLPASGGRRPNQGRPLAVELHSLALQAPSHDNRRMIRHATALSLGCLLLVSSRSRGVPRKNVTVRKENVGKRHGGCQVEAGHGNDPYRGQIVGSCSIAARYYCYLIWTSRTLNQCAAAYRN